MKLAGHEEENICFFCEKTIFVLRTVLKLLPFWRSLRHVLARQNTLYFQKTLWDILYKDFRLTTQEYTSCRLKVHLCNKPKFSKSSRDSLCKRNLQAPYIRGHYYTGKQKQLFFNCSDKAFCSFHHCIGLQSECFKLFSAIWIETHFCITQ